MGFEEFFFENADQEEEVSVVVSKRFKGKDGKPMEWKLRTLTSKEDEEIRKSCVRRVPVEGKKGQYEKETDFDIYLGKMTAACVVYPNLNDVALQDSYKVRGADVLLKAMLKSGEYSMLLKKVQEINGYDVDFDSEVEEAKN